MGKLRHIGLEKGQVGRCVLLPGAPGRVEAIARRFDDPQLIAYNREYKTVTGTLDGVPVSVTSTGIGGPSTAIAVEELFQAGADTFIRVGTCGGMQTHVMVGDVVIASAAIRAEGTSREYMPIEFPAVANFEVLSALADAAKEKTSHEKRKDLSRLFANWTGHSSHRGMITVKLKLLLKNPTMILMIAVCLVTAVLLLTYSADYRVAEQTLSRQQEAIVDRSLEYSVQIEHDYLDHEVQRVRKAVQEGQEYAIMNLAEGISLMVEADTEQHAASFAESLLALLDENQVEPTRAALSGCHHALEELPVAYREARMTMDRLVMEMDMPVMSWQQCDLSQSVMMLDGEYQARQQRFDRLILQRSIAEAQECLRTLIPDLFLNDRKIENSQIGRMHLDMVKYQMMGSLEYLYRNTAEDIELRRVGIRELLLCRTHDEVLTLMAKQLAEAAQPEEIAAEESGGDEMLTQVKMYVREHYADPQLSVASLAETFDLSPNALSKLFSRKADMGVLQYIHKIRIEKACNLMLNTALNLTDIAQQVGYTNQLTFTRSFKTRCHMTPMQWRRSKEDI